MLSFLNFLIRWSFYGIFFLVPIIFTSNTSELFEFNKMWLTFGLALIITASWIGKMILDRQIRIQRTPLDIFILLFLISQLLSTIFSIDQHTSFWGYYSRFNGGFLSLLTYAFLYYAFVTNVEKRDYLKHMFVSIASGVFVALWGLPSHFGYDPTCLIFRGTLDVSCWTNAFQPKVRIFSTMGQPDWLAAYLVYLLPITTAFSIIYAKYKNRLLAAGFLLITALFYVDLLYTRARSGFIGIVVVLGIFFVYYLFSQRKQLADLLVTPKKLLFTYWSVLLLISSIALFTFFVGSPISQLSFFSPDGVAKLFVHQKPQPTITTPAKVPSAVPTQEFGGTDSGKIRLFVWQGAWNIFLHNPILGSGVETFAFAYYQYRPVGHNLTSEWDYLYNKAHNEFLNYLATSGGAGFLTYTAMLGVFLFVAIKQLLKSNSNIEYQNSKQIQNNNAQNSKHFEHSNLKNSNLFLASNFESRILLAALLAAYIGILVTNFFGFSVVIMNIFLFLTPAFVFFAEDMLDTNRFFAFPKSAKSFKKTNEVQWIILGGVGLATCYFAIVLIRFWLADTSYALGQNFDHANEYQAAYSYLHDAVATRPSEPVFQDEMSVNDAVLAAALIQQKDTQNGSKLAQEALQTSNELVKAHPNVITYWKTRVRVLYTLSQLDSQFLPLALEAIQKANQLAPTDAKVAYNLGLLYAQNGNVQKAVDTLEQTVKLKPDYRDAYYALGLYYHQLATDKNGHLVNPDAETKAVNTMHFILANMDPTDNLKIHDTLRSWKEE